MKLAEFFIKKTVVTVLSIILLTAGGYYAYSNLGRFEDPEFVIRVAVVIVPYPGARPGEVTNEVTEVIESAVQQLQEVEKITSVSKAGVAEIQVEMNRAFSKDKAELQQLWTKLRNKLKDAERSLPPGAGPILVNDDFGDVFSLFYAITGEGYTLAEVADYAEDLRRELLLVPGVARIALLGQPEEAIFVEIARSRAALQGITQDEIYQTLKSQSTVAPAGKVRVGPKYIEIAPLGEVDSVEAISSLLISSSDGTKQVRLGDVASVRRGFKEPASALMYFNGRPAVGFGVSNVAGGNVVVMGDAVKARLAELESMRPIGMDLNAISLQSDSVRTSVDGFMDNLIAAVAIVIVTLWLFMGLRSSLVMGIVLIVTVMATLIIMYMQDIYMQRISLGALIIALGMLVDNAIVVTEGILVRIQGGDDPTESAKEVVKSTTMPLLGGTAVGALAFGAIGFSPDNTGEYAGSLFWVITYSLLLSWLFAITLTPFLCVRMLKAPKGASTSAGYDNRFYRSYRGLLRLCIRLRGLTALFMIVLLALSIAGFGLVPSGFFPESTRPQFVVDYWLPQGSHIDQVRDDLESLAQQVSSLEGVTGVTSIAGQGALRFMLTYNPESPNASYGQLLVDVNDYRSIPGLVGQIQATINESYPEAQGKAWKFVLGPGGGSKIEAAFRGPDPQVLRRLADEAKNIMYEDGGAIAIQDDWRQQMRVIRPVFSEAQARRAGVTLTDLRNSLQAAFSGSQVGIYREGDKLIPVISRLPEQERLSVDEINQVQVYSPMLRRYIPIAQVVSGFESVFENGIIRRENRFPTIQAQCGPRAGELASTLLDRIRPKIEAIELPPGYSLVWNGEYGDSTKAQKGIMGTLPLCFLSMVVTVVVLFNASRQPLIIWLTVPLSIIGVTIGLLLFQAPFEFMAILGFLSLTGMLIKNAIVLVDQIDLEIGQGKERFAAILDSAASRVRPVCMGAVTTILGVAPLLLDPFFKSMAVTIMFGLAFATGLTLLFVPVLYAIFFRIPVHQGSQ
ncbi:MAG: efflux RND transporter permease subunit [Candidatus Hydrogenedentes bacterium]|nr:efflux RND transporter permease subunit [Candidatus Hydrogenedentota bacterium]